MAKIDNLQDWIDAAQSIIPKLEPYMREFGNAEGAEKLLNKHFKNKDWRQLHTVFQHIWEWLPNSHEIRKPPFYDLCDLCSEVWVFDETEQKE
jgi:hypothetical protein